MTFDRRASILAEAAEMAMHHPSKDARDFACEVNDFLLAAHAGAAAEPAEIDWQHFDDGKTADAMREMGIRLPTLRDVTNLQKAMASAYRAALTSAPAEPSDEQIIEAWAKYSHYGFSTITNRIERAREILAIRAPAETPPAAAPAAEGVAKDWAKIEAVVDAYIDDYEMRGETEDGRDACYTPNDNDRALLRDCIAGLLAEPEFIASLAAPGAAIDARDFKDAIRAAEISHSGMSYGDEKNGSSSEYARGWGDCLKAIRGAASHPCTANVWQQVPPTPTREMIEAAASTPEAKDAKQDIENMWRAMLAAAPLGAIDAREQEAKDGGFNSGTVAALAILRAHDSEVQWHEVLQAAGADKVLYYAAHIEPEDWQWGGFAYYKMRKPKKRAALASRQEAPAAAGAAQAVAIPITASVMIDEGGDKPAYCLMAAYRHEADAMLALSTLAATSAPEALTDEQLAATAYKGYDDYWTEDSAGKESEAWAASAKAVLALKAAQPVERGEG